MSYIRMGQERRWTDGVADLYAYPSAAGIVVTDYGTIPARDWVEVAMRMLERGDFSDDELEAMYQTLRDAAHMDTDPEDLSNGPEEMAGGQA